MAQQGVTWNLKDLLGGRTPEQIISETEKHVDEFVAARDKLDSLSPEELAALVALKENIIFDLEAVGSYYDMQFSENTQDQEALAKMTKYQQRSAELGNRMVFFPLWFMHLDEEKAQGHMNAPELAPYKYYLEQVRKAKNHTKSEEIEQIITLKSMTGGGAFSDLYDIFTSSFRYDFNGEEELGQEELKKYILGKDPKKRQEAYELLLGRYGEHSTMLGEVYKNIILDWYNEGITIRKYPTPISIRNDHNDIDDKAVQALLNVTRRNAGVFADYFKLKHDLNKRLGENYNHSRYHLYAPFALQPEKTYDYEESKQIVLDVYKEFDKQFYEAAKAIFDADHVHSHPKPNKRSGAYCSYLGSRTKPYIFLNHTDTLRDVFTMAHEFGHGIHGVLAEEQTDLLHHAALPMAETASIFGEMLLSEKLLAATDDEKEQAAIITQMLDDRYGSIGRQAFFVLFEEEAHRMIQEGATKDELDQKYQSLLKEQFGNMEIPDVFKHEWNYIPHLHHTPFYCYAYAWGNLLVLALYAMYRKEGKTFVEKYTSLLAAGGSKRPQELLAALGIDPADESFWEQGYTIIREQVTKLKEIGERL